MPLRLLDVSREGNYRRIIQDEIVERGGPKDEKVNDFDPVDLGYEASCSSNLSKISNRNDRTNITNVSILKDSWQYKVGAAHSTLLGNSS